MRWSSAMAAAHPTGGGVRGGRSGVVEVGPREVERQGRVVACGAAVVAVDGRGRGGRRVAGGGMSAGRTGRGGRGQRSRWHSTRRARGARVGVRPGHRALTRRAPRRCGRARRATSAGCRGRWRRRRGAGGERDGSPVAGSVAVTVMASAVASASMSTAVSLGQGLVGDGVGGSGRQGAPRGLCRRRGRVVPPGGGLAGTGCRRPTGASRNAAWRRCGRRRRGGGDRGERDGPVDGVERHGGMECADVVVPHFADGVPQSGQTAVPRGAGTPSHSEEWDWDGTSPPSAWNVTCPGCPVCPNHGLTCVYTRMSRCPGCPVCDSGRPIRGRGQVVSRARFGTLIHRCHRSTSNAPRRALRTLTASSMTWLDAFNPRPFFHARTSRTDASSGTWLSSRARSARRPSPSTRLPPRPRRRGGAAGATSRGAARVFSAMGRRAASQSRRNTASDTLDSRQIASTSPDFAEPPRCPSSRPCRCGRGRMSASPACLIARPVWR